MDVLRDFAIHEKGSLNSPSGNKMMNNGYNMVVFASVEMCQ